MGRSLSTMRRAKGVHHKDIAERRVVGRQHGIIRGLAHIESHVFQEHDITGQRRNMAPVLCQ